MIGKKIVWTRRAALVAALVLVVLAGLAPGRAAGLDPAKMNADEIKALERRLTDAGCYKGAIDGSPSAPLDDAMKTCPDQRPFLRIETGMHVNEIASFGVDAACSLLATGSTDKTIRLWSMPEGKLKRVVRLPIGQREAGEIEAVALSLDGRWLAVGDKDPSGATGKHVLTIIDLANGSIRRFGTFKDYIRQISFSVDEQLVAAGLGDEGLRVFDTATGNLLLADEDYRYPFTLMDLAFARDGGLIVLSDKELRRYGPNLKLEVKVPKPQYARSIAVDPSGKRVADVPTLSIFDAGNLAFLGKPSEQDYFDEIAWSRDGEILIASGNYSTPILRRFNGIGQRVGSDVVISPDLLYSEIQPCGDHFVIVRSNPPRITLLSAQDEVRTLQSSQTADMEKKVGLAFTLSPDAKAVRFGLGEGDQEPVIFDLTAASLKSSPSVPPRYLVSRVDGLPVTDWEGLSFPKFNGVELPHADQFYNALAVRSGASGFVLGGNERLSAYGADGKELWSRPSPASSSVTGVNFSADGEILVSSPMTTGRSTGSAGATERSCSLSSSSREAANGLSGRPPAITWPRSVARI